jgi:hypothetical protein
LMVTLLLPVRQVGTGQARFWSLRRERTDVKVWFLW